MTAHIPKLYLTATEEDLYAEFIQKIFVFRFRSLRLIYAATFGNEVDLRHGKRLALTNRENTQKYIAICHRTIPT